MSLDEECDDSNVLNGNDRTCRLEQQFICKDSVCIKPELLIQILIQAGDQSIQYNILLQFNNDIDFNKDVEVFILNGQEEINIKQQCDITFNMNNQFIQTQIN
ncbi:unnamed protein product [Paramecium primaurelia]|uniref:Uncharacterized protein n=1 Tax=Paramecium primaurelia TaxID=5886 RepID=A0A8S1QLH8_PARPR|nr:unnamed protein product [Paramecium primaurelia]